MSGSDPHERHEPKTGRSWKDVISEVVDDTKRTLNLVLLVTLPPVLVLALVGFIVQPITTGSAFGVYSLSGISSVVLWGLGVLVRVVLIRWARRRHPEGAAGPAADMGKRLGQGEAYEPDDKHTDTQDVLDVVEETLGDQDDDQT